jgi:hypothetical protein
MKTTDKLTYTDVLKGKRRSLLAILQQHGQDEDKCYQSDWKPSRIRQDLIVSNKSVLDSNTDSTDKMQLWRGEWDSNPRVLSNMGLAIPRPTRLGDPRSYIRTRFNSYINNRI